MPEKIMNDKDICKINDIIKTLSLKDFEDSVNNLSDEQKENIKLGKKTLSDYGGVSLSQPTKEAIKTKEAYLNDEISEKQYLDWIDEHDINQAVFAENIKDFIVNDNTNDYGTVFHFNIAIGSNGEGRTVYADMSGYVKDAEADNFGIVAYADDVKDGEMQGYYLFNNSKEVFIELPCEIQNMLIECTKSAVIAAEVEKIKGEAIWFAEPVVDMTDNNNCPDGLVSIEVGDFNGNPIYADFNAEVREDYSILPNHDKGRYYLTPVYNIDKGKAYICVPNEDFGPDRAIYIDMPHNVLEKCKKIAAETACKFKCEELHERLYKEYLQNYNDGFELGSDLKLPDDIDKDTDPIAHVAMEYEEWLQTTYPDEEYFISHVEEPEARYLCEHDELINLDFIGLYKETIKACISITKDDFIEGAGPETYEVSDPSVFEKDMDKLISRSVKPDLVKEISNKYMLEENGHEVNSYADLYRNNGIVDFYDYVGFDVDGDNITAYIRLSFPDEEIELGQIPLSATEQTFVMKAIDRYEEKHQLNTSKTNKDIEPEK